jgi:hypothetical protein
MLRKIDGEGRGWFRLLDRGKNLAAGMVWEEGVGEVVLFHGSSSGSLARLMLEWAWIGRIREV